MGELIDMESARDLVAEQGIWPRVRDFLWDFAPQVHPSWLAGIASGAPEGPDAARPSGALAAHMSNPHVKTWILKELGVEPCFHTFPEEDFSRLLLLDGATLESLVKWIGALACADRLRGITDGKTVRALKAALPGVYPEVFGYTAYFDRFRIEGLALKLEDGFGEKIGTLGTCILLSLFDSLPAALVSRLMLKLPKAYSGEPPVDAGHQPSAVNLQFLTRLLKLKFPEAYTLCCS